MVFAALFAAINFVLFAIGSVFIVAAIVWWIVLFNRKKKLQNKKPGKVKFLPFIPLVIGLGFYGGIVLVCVGLISGINTLDKIQLQNKERAYGTLGYAVYMKDYKEVQRLLESGSNPDERGQESDSGSYVPLVVACENDDKAMIKLLLQHNADVNTKSRKNATALISAAWNGDFEITKLLLERGADINAQTSSGTTALMSAAYSHHLEVTKLLITHGADVNAQDSEGNTALILSEFADSDYVSYLIEHGADITIINSNGQRALHKYCYNMEGAKTLLENDDDVNFKDKEGRTLLMLLCSDIGGFRPGNEKETYDFIKMLVENNADVSLTDNNGETAKDIMLETKATVNSGKYAVDEDEDMEAYKQYMKNIEELLESDQKN
jgi:ankyrin repeat protein